jgi:hypothetical protein
MSVALGRTQEWLLRLPIGAVRTWWCHRSCLRMAVSRSAASSSSCTRKQVASGARSCRRARRRSKMRVPRCSTASTSHRSSWKEADPSSRTTSGRSSDFRRRSGTPAPYLAFLRAERIPYLVVGEDRVDLTAALRRMADRLGVTCVVSKAGGGLNGALLRAGLVDELQIVMVPGLIGGKLTPALFDGPELTVGERDRPRFGCCLRRSKPTG